MLTTYFFHVLILHMYLTPLPETYHIIEQVYTKVYIVQRGLGHTIVFYVIVKHDLKSRSSASSTPAHVSGQSYLEQRTRASNWFQ